MFEFISGFEAFVIAGAVFLIILGIANLKKADTE